MSDQEEMLNKMREIALLNPENIRIIEASVNSEIQLEFFETLQSVIKLKNTADEPQELFKALNNPSNSLIKKKEILVKLVSYGEVETYRIIESYLKNPEPELKSWAYMAYQQARMFLESNLLEESKIYIASGLGGKDHRLRYNFAFTSKNKSFDKTQKSIINGEIEYFLKKNDGIIEQLKYKKSFVICTALVPIHINLVEMIQDMILEINQYGNFLKENVFLTNEKQITEVDLEHIFNEDKSDNIADKD
ncbi:MAG TPA: hypothetical protein PKN32_03320 [Bacteroidales bacterium]|nr:hypothetical protein [Bacteroidales bacterium]